MKKNKKVVTVSLYDELEAYLDFAGHEDKEDQFAQYLTTHDMTDFLTVCNLQDWAKARNIPCELKAKGFFSPRSMLVRIMVKLYSYCGHTIMPKKKNLSEIQKEKSKKK